MNHDSAILLMLAEMRAQIADLQMRLAAAAQENAELRAAKGADK
jgi:hypothetical protein